MIFAVDEPVTPELALVDPELARRARVSLPDLPGRVSAVRIVPREAREAEAETSREVTGTVAGRPSAGRGALWRAALSLGVLSVTTASLWLIVVRPRVDADPPRTAESAASTPAGASAPGNRLAPDGASTRDRVTLPSGKSASRTIPLPTRPVPPTRTSSAPSAGLPSRPTTQQTPTAPTAELRPVPPSPTPPRPEVFGWVPVPRATHYRVEFFRGRTKIFEALPAVPRLELPRSWRYRGRLYRFVGGGYTWVVRPGFGPRPRARYGREIVRATLKVPVTSG